jgi:hypothetical protein
MAPEAWAEVCHTDLTTRNLSVSQSLLCEVRVSESLQQSEDLLHGPANVTPVDHQVPHSPCPVDDKGGPGWSPAVPGYAHALGEGEVLV